MKKEIVKGYELSRARRIMIILLVSFGSSILFQIIYLRFVFYQPMIEALNITNSQLGNLGGIYGLVATIFYLPGGFLADKVRAKYLASIGFFTTALAIFWFATLPSYGVLVLIFGLLGVTSVGVFWGIRYKLVRLVSDDITFSRNIGLSYGVYGLSGLILNFIGLQVFESVAAEPARALVTVLLISGILNVIFGVLTLFIVPKFADEIKPQAGFNFDELKEAIKHPGVWLTTASMFFVYGVYAAIVYTTPYLTEVFGASLTMVALVGMIRTYGITLLSAPIVGSISTKINSPAKVLIIIMGLTAVAGIVLGYIPTTASFVILAIIVVLIAGFFSSGAYGIASGQFGETGVPTRIFGTATGLLSVIAFIPDMFVPVFSGKWLDQFPGIEGYRIIFWVFIVGFSVLAVLSSIGVRLYVKKAKPELDLHETVDVQETP